MLKKGILLFLLALSALFSVSCGDGDAPVVQNGILIEADAPAAFSEEVQVRAENAIYALMKGYFEKTVSPTLPEKTLEKLRAESKAVTALTQKHPLTEKQYVELIACVEENTDAILSYLSEPMADMAQIKALYRALSAPTDADYVGDTVYHILSYAYDYKYRECMERYEAYGYAFLLEDAERFLAEKTVLEVEVGKEGFADATKSFFFFAELFESGIAEAGMMDSFTDEELLVLLKNIDLGMESITPAGYELLLSYIPSSAEGDYFSRLLQAAKENGDTTLLAGKMGDALRLFSLCLEKTAAEDCRYVRAGDAVGLIGSTMEKFDGEDWALFAAVTAVEPKNADYDRIAAEAFGEAYAAYVAQIEVCTLAELKQSVGTEKFSKALKGYVAGICPVLVYGMSHD